MLEHCFKQLHDTMDVILQLLVKNLFSLVPYFVHVIKFSVKSAESQTAISHSVWFNPFTYFFCQNSTPLYMLFYFFLIGSAKVSWNNKLFAWKNKWDMQRKQQPHGSGSSNTTPSQPCWRVYSKTRQWTNEKVWSNTRAHCHQEWWLLHFSFPRPHS